MAVDKQTSDRNEILLDTQVLIILLIAIVNETRICVKAGCAGERSLAGISTLLVFPAPFLGQTAESSRRDVFPVLAGHGSRMPTVVGLFHVLYHFSFC